VVKVGSSTVSRHFDLRPECIDRLVDDLATVKQGGTEVILVTSGAIAAGTGELGLSQRPQTIPGLQAAAAVGQSRLMHAYENRFQRYNQVAGMLLLTREDFNDRKRYIHISDTLRTLLQFGAVPIINENDTVAVEEIQVGDNDTLAAYVTNLAEADLPIINENDTVAVEEIQVGDNDTLAAYVTNLAEADLLVILSDQDGFYTADPRKVPGAELITVISSITEETQRAAGESNTADGTGGMVTKLQAAEIVTGSGEMMVLANGAVPQVVNRILAGEELGTLFLPQERMSARKRWIVYSRPPRGTLVVDNGAHDALVHRGKSLLPSGLRSVEGRFEHGDTVSCLDENRREFARGLVNYNAQEAKAVMGKRTGEIKKILGYHYYDEVIHRDNLVLMQKA
jgi:glutamate 5-kinase